MSVQRYELEIYHCNGGEMIVSDTGDYVSHDDYAALEAKCAALAADNDKAMEAMRQADEVVKRAHSKFAALADENMALRSAIENGMTAPETPSTDAYLAEVRAQGVEMYAEHLTRKAIASGENKNHAYAYLAANFAAKLRKDANTAELVAAGIITKVGE